MSVETTQNEFLLAGQILRSQMPLVVVETVLPQDEFIDRYTDYVELGTTVTQSVDTTEVSGARLTVHRVGVMYSSCIVPWTGSRLSREDANQKVKVAIEQKEKIARYLESGNLRRTASIIRFAFGRKKSNFIGVTERKNPIPDVIFDDRVSNGITAEVIIDERTAERIQRLKNNYTGC